MTKPRRHSLIVTADRLRNTLEIYGGGMFLTERNAIDRVIILLEDIVAESQKPEETE